VEVNMRKKVVNKIVQYIKSKKKLSKDEEDIIVYGLESLYILITKLFIISLVAYLLDIFIEYIIFLLLFNIIRIFAYGLHATKSYICLIISLLAFTVLPYICIKMVIPFVYKIVIGIVLILLTYKNSPADTHKRPLINKKRRYKLKITSTIISIIYIILSLFVSNFISNALIFSLLLENIFISPTTYKIFKLPYNNYLNYIKEEKGNVFN
jgi:accessory gene regulator B